MKCRSCGAENREGMKFCTSCGSKLEQKVTCPSCGSEAEEGAAFCGQCGTKLASASVKAKKPEQKAEPAVQAVTEPAPEKKAAPESAEQNEFCEEVKPFTFSAKKTFGLASAILVIALSVALLAFVCFIGLSSTSKLSGVTDKGAVGILDYFGRAYTELPAQIEKLRESIQVYSKETLSGFFIFTLYLPYILSTLTLASTIILVVVFSIIALVAAIKKLLGNSNADGGRKITFAYIAYMIGAVLIKSFSGGSAISGSYSTKVGFNGATIAGITVCSTLFGLFILCKFLSRGKELLNAKVIANSAFALAGIALAGVIIGMTAAPAYSVYYDGATSKCGYIQAIVSVGAMGMTSSSLETLTFPYLTSMMMLVSAVLGIAVVVFAGCSMRRCLSVLLRKSDKALFVSEIVSAFCALLLLVFAAVSGSLLAGVPELAEGASQMRVTPVGSIAIFILALLLLGVMIARVCVNNYLSKKPLAVEGGKKAAPKTEEAEF